MDFLRHPHFFHLISVPYQPALSACSGSLLSVFSFRQDLLDQLRALIDHAVAVRLLGACQPRVSCAASQGAKVCFVYNKSPSQQSRIIRMIPEML